MLADAYAAADCVVFPSRYEGCSLVVLEALACGRPLLTTRVGWMGTLLRAVPAYDALCIEPTVEAIALRLRQLENFQSAELCAAARAFVLANNGLARWATHWGELIDHARCAQAERGFCRWRASIALLPRHARSGVPHGGLGASAAKGTTRNDQGGASDDKATLVTGGSGYIGALLVRELQSAGREVRVLDSLLHGQEEIAAEQEGAASR